MKKILSIKLFSMLLMVLICFLASSNICLADNGITVKIDGQAVAFDVSPQIINNRTMVPMRKIFETLGATVEWDQNTKTVTSTKGGTTVSLTIDNPNMNVNGNVVTLDTPACIVDNRTLVPVRAIAEAFQTEVNWDEGTKTVIINKPKNNVEKGNTNPSEILKSYLSENGYKSGDGYAISPRFENNRVIISWEPGKIIFTNITYDDKNNMTEDFSLWLEENKSPAINCTIVNKYGNDEFYYGTYDSPKKITFHWYQQPPYLIYQINSFYKYLDDLLESWGLNIKIKDFGIEY